jgi:hypothetical protein
MKEEKGIIQYIEEGGPTYAARSLPQYNSAFATRVRGEITGDNIYRCQSVCPVVLNDFEF